MTAEMKRQGMQQSVDEANKATIKRLDDEFAEMGAERSPKKAMNRMKAAIAKDENRKATLRR